MNTLKNLLYSQNHEWFDPDTGKIGITDFAQSELGDIVFISLPESGVTLAAGDTLCDLESVKAVSDIYCPVNGTISEVNESLLDAPETINENAYDAWFAIVKDCTLPDDLMTAEEYTAFCEEEN